jgi:phosphohistidine phosphatase
MELILWRHADAEDPGPAGDAARRLTRRGRRQAAGMAEWLRPRLEGEWRIVVSPAARTRETAEALGLPFEVRDTVSTSATAHGVLREAGWPSGALDTLVVGHQPTLGEVAALLLGGEAGEVSVRKGAILWFAQRERGGRTETLLKAVLDPDMLEGPGTEAE